ncbi:MAG: LamG-like jellyroll fold domain-containing protein [Nitrososphaerales archaeon]
MVVLLIVPSISTQSFINWADIPILNWVKACGAFLVVFVYPGYGILTLVSRNDKLSRLEKGILSVGLSLFLATLLGFIGLMQGNFTNSYYYLLILNLSLFVAVFCRFIKNHRRETLSHSNFRLTDLITLVIMCALVLFYIVVFFLMHFPDRFVAGYDHWRHYGETLRTINAHILIPRVWNYIALYMFTGLFLFSSGLPSLNSYMALYPLLVLPILSFYLVSKLLLKNEESIVATIVFSLFSGFGGLYAIYLNLTRGIPIYEATYQTQSLGDVFTGVHGLSFWLHPQQFGLFILLLTFYLVLRDFQSRLLRILMIAAFVTLGIYIHFSEIVLLFVIVLFVYIFYNKYLSKPWDILISFVVAILLVLVFFLMSYSTLPSPKLFFEIYAGGKFFHMLIGIAAVVGFCSILLFIRTKFNFSKYLKTFTSLSRSNVLRLSLTVLTIYLYMLSFIVWNNVADKFTLSAASYMTPWYIYPLRFGTIFLLALITVLFMRKFISYNALIIGVILAISPIIIAVVSDLLFIYSIWESPIPDARITMHVNIGLAILSPILPLKLIRTLALKQNKSMRHGVIAFLFIIMMFISGISSTLLFARAYFEYYSVRYGSDVRLGQVLSGNDMEIIDQIRNLTKHTEVILAPWPWNSFIYQFAEHESVGFDLPTLARPFMTINPELFFDTIRRNIYSSLGKEVKYLLLDKNQINGGLPANVGLLSELMNILPIKIENKRIILLEIPQSSPPTANSILAVLKPQHSTTLETEDFAVSLNGRDSYIAIPPSEILNEAKTSMTWEVWIKIEGNEDDWRCILEFGNFPLISSHFYIKNDGRLYFNLITEDRVEHVLWSTTPVPLYEWLHIALTYNGTVGKLYVNGQEVAKSFFKGKVVCEGSLQIGMRGKNNYPFYGQVDDVRIYKRSLSLEEIKSRALGYEVDRSDLILDINFNSGDALDMSGYNNNGKIINGRVIGRTSEPLIARERTYSFIIKALSLKNLNYTTYYSEDFEFLSKLKTNKVKVLLTPYDFSEAYPPPYIQDNILEWIKEGGKLIILNGEGASGHKFFAKELAIHINQTTTANGIIVNGKIIPLHTLKLPIFLSLNNRSNTISYYSNDGNAVSSHIFAGKFYNGTIYFVELYPYLNYLLQTRSSNTYYELISPAIPTEVILPYRDELRGTDRVLLFGLNSITNATLMPKSFFIPSMSKFAVNLELPLSENNQSEDILRNIKLLSLELSENATPIITSSRINIVSENTGRYSTITFPEGFTLVIRIFDKGYARLTILHDEKTMNFNISRGDIKIEFLPSQDLRIIATRVNVSSTTHSEFERVQVDWTLGINAVDTPFYIDGPVNFIIDGADDSMVVLSELLIKGEYKAISLAKSSWNEWWIPRSILDSREFVLLNYITVVGLIFIIVSFYRKSKY